MGQVWSSSGFEESYCGRTASFQERVSMACCYCEKRIYEIILWRSPYKFRTVLTAAHCNVYSAFQVRVHVGEHDLTTSDGEQKMSVRRWTNHPSYNRNNNDNDFAVIELSSDVRFSDTVMPICMPNPSSNYDNRVATVAGWGTTSSGGSTTTTPQEVDVDTITNSACTTNTLY